MVSNNKKHYQIFHILALLVLFSCTPQTKRTSTLRHIIVSEQIEDIPLKSQIVQHVLIQEQSYGESDILVLLKELFDRAKNRTGFKYRSRASNIYIYAYTSHEKAVSAGAQWVGMISIDPTQETPLSRINDIQLKSLTEPSVDKWGIPHEKRKSIWLESIQAEKKAQEKADEKYPYWELNSPKDYLEKNIDLFRELQAQHNKQLLEKHHIQPEILDSISLEGVLKGWSYPKN